VEKSWSISYLDKQGDQRNIVVQAQSHKDAIRRLPAAIVKWWQYNTHQGSQLPGGYELARVVRVRSIKCSPESPSAARVQVISAMRD